MKEKEKYSGLEVEVIVFETEDVIMDSPTSNNETPIGNEPKG